MEGSAEIIRPGALVDRSPSSRYIADTLAERIRVGTYKGGQWFPSERALAGEFEVSRMIVRLAIRDLEERDLLVRSARCRPLVRSGSPGPAEAGPAKDGGHTARRSLALWVWPHPLAGTSSALLRGVRLALNQDDFRLVWEGAQGDAWADVQASEQRFFQRIMRDRDIEGILLWYIGGASHLPDLQALRSAGIPLVFVDRLPPAGFEADYVGLDNVGAAERAVGHLIAQGHRRIAHVTNQDTASPVTERLSGYHRALRLAHLPAPQEMLVQDTGRLQDDRGCVAVVDRLLALPEPPTAIFAVNDMVAFRVVTALHARARRVPQDMAVAGIDGIERWAPGAPFLTTIEQPFERMGALAVDLLLSRLDAGPTAPYKHVILDAPLVVRDSTRPSGERGR